MPVTIRIGSAPDLLRIATLRAAESPIHRSSNTDGQQPAHATAHRVLQLVPPVQAATSHPVCDLLVAEVVNGETGDSSLVGFVKSVRAAPDLPLLGSEIAELFVLQSHRRQGIASRLLASVRETNQCASWVRVDKANLEALQWFGKRDYRYAHTEFAEGSMLSVLRWPGRFLDRPAVPADLPMMYELFVRSVFLNPGIQHGTAVPADFLDIVSNRIFPSAALAGETAAFTAIPTVYFRSEGEDGAKEQELAGFHVIHISPDRPRDVELNMFCTDAALGAKDLGNYLIQRVIEEYGWKSSVLVKTWEVNTRALAFYKKNGFEEVSREHPGDAAGPAKVCLRRPGPPSLE